MPRHNFCKSDGRQAKLFRFSTFRDKSPLTSVYFATFEKKREVRSPLPHNRTFWFLVNIHNRYRDIEIYKICVEVFEKTISRTETIDNSFERKFYEACHRLC